MSYIRKDRPYCKHCDKPPDDINEGYYRLRFGPPEWECQNVDCPGKIVKRDEIENMDFYNDDGSVQANVSFNDYGFATITTYNDKKEITNVKKIESAKFWEQYKIFLNQNKK